MLKHATFVGAFALLTAPAFAQDADTVVATINGTDITLGEMILVRTQLPAQYQGFPDDVLFTGILDQLIQQQLLADAAGEEPSRVTYALANERRTLMAGELINVIAVDAVTDEAVAAAFAELNDGQTPGVEWNAAHLLVETEEEALAARARVVDGGEEFADVARAVSTGPSGPSGGNLGWFRVGQMVPPFEAAVAELAVGDVSEPVETQFGWHIINLIEQRDVPLPELEQVRPQLEAQLQEAAITARIEALREVAEITMPEEGAFDPTLLQNLDLLEPK